MTQQERDAKIAAAIIKILHGEAKPVKLGAARPDPINESPSYRSAMLDAGRGRLLR